MNDMSQTRTYVVGRGSECDIRLNNDSVSRRHAEVTWLSDGRACVTDLESTNGTFVADGSAWRAFRQEFLEPTESVRFGDCDINVGQLEGLCRDVDRAVVDYPGFGAARSTLPDDEASASHPHAAPDHESAESPVALAPGTRLEEFTIERVLGAGGFGVTYLARDESLGAWRALKEYLPRDWGTRLGDGTIGPRTESDADDFRWGLERFLDEARVLAQFDHPNIVRVYRKFEVCGTAYMVTEYVEGRTLAEEVEATGLLSESHVRDMLAALTAGLAEVHAAGVWHRDIKPANVMLRADGTPVLIDFGAARYSMGHHSQSLMAVLTPGFAPIEQYSPRGRQGPWTDIYALGAVAYWALSGKTPHDSPERVREDPLPSLATVAPRQASRELASTVGAALAVHAKDRPQSLDEWRARLEPPESPEPRWMPGGLWLRWILANAAGWAVAATTVEAGHEALGLGGGTGVFALLEVVYGALIGTAQWLLLRRLIPRAGWWVAASAAGTALGGIVSLALPVSTAVFLVAAVLGAVIGTVQWSVLHRRVDRAGWWVPASVAGTVVAAAVLDRLPLVDPGAYLDVALWGATNGALYGVITGLVLDWLSHSRRPRASPAG